MAQPRRVGKIAPKAPKSPLKPRFWTEDASSLVLGSCDRAASKTAHRWAVFIYRQKDSFLVELKYGIRT